MISAFPGQCAAQEDVALVVWNVFVAQSLCDAEQ